VNKILVINLARMGDIVQSLPMLNGLKRIYPESSLSLLVNKSFSQVCSLMPHIDECIPVDFSCVKKCMYSEHSTVDKIYQYLSTFYEILRKQNYNKVINITPHYIGYYSSLLAKNRIGHSDESSDWYNFYISITRNWKTLPIHVADLFSKVAGISPYIPSEGLSISAEAYCRADQLLKRQGVCDTDILIGFHTGASTPEKQWPIRFYQELAKNIIDTLGAKIILLGSDEDPAAGNNFKALFCDHVINAINQTDLETLGALTKRIKVLVTNDTGPMHIAAAC